MGALPCVARRFFSDIVGFTDISATLSPELVSDMLDRLCTLALHAAGV